MRSFFSLWHQCFAREVKDVHLRKAPLTDLMDSVGYRTEKETVLSSIQGLIANNNHILPKYVPYALNCLQQAYRRIREDNLYSKCANVVVSRFKLSYQPPEGKAIDVEGILLYNINADNNVATYIAVLGFDSITAKDIILLKHIFYKRLAVKITEYEIVQHPCGYAGCATRKHFNCITGKLKTCCRPFRSFQEYIAGKDACQTYAKRHDIDFRARYSFVELTNDVSQCPNDELYGIIMADEGYSFVSSHTLNNTFEVDLSTRKTFSLYLSGLNGLIITRSNQGRDECKVQQEKFEKDLYNEDERHIKTESIKCHCIAGVMEEFFPTFLKGVEIHFLMNNILTSETEHNDRSYLNPVIFIRRSFKLWNILYELDVNRYHINTGIHNAFGINDTLEKVREEYMSILQHAINYLIIVFTLVQILIAII
ncbi:MAG: hypothetical protein IKZ48_01710 [Prevotella sp.]|nr:hypothetical protein [Prevotella sp.]